MQLMRIAAQFRSFLTKAAVAAVELHIQQTHQPDKTDKLQPQIEMSLRRQTKAPAGTLPGVQPVQASRQTVHTTLWRPEFACSELSLLLQPAITCELSLAGHNIAQRIRYN